SRPRQAVVAECGAERAIRGRYFSRGRGQRSVHHQAGRDQGRGRSRYPDDTLNGPLLGIAVKAHAVGSQPLQVQDGRDHAFAGEAVERPEQHAIELALVGILEQRSELLAVLGALPAAFMVNVLVHELVASAGAPLPQLPQLVLRILTFVVGTDASVDTYAHLAALRLTE